jgi:hypothetical protein
LVQQESKRFLTLRDGCCDAPVSLAARREEPPEIDGLWEHGIPSNTM